MPNRLADSTSPYLLQHQDNPVDWYPWGEEAFQRARAEDKPVFLSVGYSACHWCHVMAHESFENQVIADILNRHFISIKVDREQRPDVDQVYMQAVQMLTGSGGWPLSIFMTADGRPFFGGTYWPPENRYGRPGFAQVLLSVANAWQERRADIDQHCAEMVGHLQNSLNATAAAADEDELSLDLLMAADRWLDQSFEPRFGGFGTAPKFPHSMDLMLLMRLQSRTPNDDRLHRITHTLDRMAAGGIYDHLGGGFARYSVDDRWLVPHFEKMLYDNGLLASAYLDAYLLTHKPAYRTIVEETLDYILRDMTDPAGGFYSAEDADSEGEEGKFYVWTPQEIAQVLGNDAAKTFCIVYDVTPAGNFEGHSILNLRADWPQLAEHLGVSENDLRQQMARDRQKLLEHRSQRVRPGLDDKVIVSWNALMIEPMARAGIIFDQPNYLDAAQKCASFLLIHMESPNGGLLHNWRRGKSEIDGFLDDYTYLIHALVTLFECDGQAKWLEAALKLTEFVDQNFADDRGGYFFTGKDSEQLITRSKDMADHSVPSGNAMAANAWLRLAELTGNEELRQTAVKTLRAAQSWMQRAPGAAGQMLMALDTHLGPADQWVALAGSPEIRQKLAATIHGTYLPRAVRVIAAYPDMANRLQPLCPGLLSHRNLEPGQTEALFICRDNRCELPLVGFSDILSAVENSVTARR